MSESEHPKKPHDWHSWVGVAITVLGTWASIIASYAVLRERVNTQTEQQIDHERRIRDLEHDGKLAEEIGQLRIQVTRLEGKIEALSAEQSRSRRDR